jgi:hypothetical protein
MPAFLALLATVAQATAPVDTLEEAWSTSRHEDEAFFRPVGAIVTDAEEVWVLDGGNSTIYVYDLAGTPVRTIGRRGGGPGEFVTPSPLLERGDSILVWDRRQQRVTFLDLAGDYLGSREVAVAPPSHGFVRTLRVRGDTTWIFTDNYPGDEPPDDESLSEIWRFVGRTLEGRRIFKVPGREIRIKRLSSWSSRHPAPFARAPFLEFLPDGGFLYGNSGYANFLRFDENLAPVDTIRLELPRLDVLPAERAAFSDSVRQALEADFSRGGVGPTYRERYRRELRPFLESMEFPEQHQAYLLVEVIDGLIWLSLPTPSTDRFHELRSYSLSDGTPTSRVFIPKWGTLIEFDPSPHGLLVLEISRENDERRVAMFGSVSTGRQQ